ncbi:hypothetical protein [Candidatus Poriferisocius sp.]|uniref:hypothetical protein n=1 Tax=Candidatus Poriferisocius sp. TaxID=3101276 RepID=UPI003B0237A2
MTISELERTELASNLVVAIGKEPTETLMQCILPDGREQLATKDDLKVLRSEMRSEISELRSEMRSEISELRSEMRSEISELRGYIDLALSKQTRIYLVTMIGFMVTIWGTLAVHFVA